MASDIVILTGQGNYTTWLRSLKSSANAEGVWDLISGTEEIKALPKRPIGPDISAICDNAEWEGLDDAAITEAIKDLGREWECTCEIYELEVAEYDSQRKRVVAANFLILNSASDLVRRNIHNSSEPHTTYRRIKEVYKPTKARILRDSHKQLADLKLWRCDDVPDFINKAKSLRQDIIDEGDTYSDSQFAFKIIHSLGRGYERFVDICEEELDRPDAPVPTSETVLSYLST